MTRKTLMKRPLTSRPHVNKVKEPSKRTLELRKLFGGLPRCKHKPDKGKPYDPAKSEVIAWLMAHPQAGQVLFDVVRDAKAILFRDDQWVGCNTLRREGGR